MIGLGVFSESALVLLGKIALGMLDDRLLFDWELSLSRVGEFIISLRFNESYGTERFSWLGSVSVLNR